MTQDEIMEMWNSITKYAPSEVRIAEFAKLVAAKATAVEREACAKLCDVLAVHPEYASEITKLAAQAIRNRG